MKSARLLCQWNEMNLLSTHRNSHGDHKTSNGAKVFQSFIQFERAPKTSKQLVDSYRDRRRERDLARK